MRAGQRGDPGHRQDPALPTGEHEGAEAVQRHLHDDEGEVEGQHEPAVGLRGDVVVVQVLGELGDRRGLGPVAPINKSSIPSELISPALATSRDTD